jgi:hypothetical protein
MEERISLRRAIEALRSGVPNRDAVLALGCSQAEIDDKFRSRLAEVKQERAATGGLLVKGDFGTGKSHLFEYLKQVALEQNFVVSKVVISKETPLHDPAKLFRAAIASAVVPGRRGDALTEIAASLRFDSAEYSEFSRLVNAPDDLNARFAATLFLFRDISNQAPELRDWILRFWGGERIGALDLKRQLRERGEAASYPIDKIPEKELAPQRFRFAAQLMRAAGFAGWVLLFDEVELIGRYSLKQRAASYAELAGWMGRRDGMRLDGITSVLAMTEDFQAAVLDARNDRERIPGKYGFGDRPLVKAAECGMRIIEREGLSHKRPDDVLTRQTHERVKAIYARAYDWEPTEIPSHRTDTSTSIRQYVKRWIHEWDLRRLDPAAAVELEIREIPLDYAEDPNLQSDEDR